MVLVVVEKALAAALGVWAALVAALAATPLAETRARVWALPVRAAAYRVQALRRRQATQAEQGLRVGIAVILIAFLLLM